MNRFILLEDRKASAAEKSSLYFNQPIEEIRCYDPHELTPCLDRMEVLRDKGHYLVGFISYEASYLFEESLIQDVCFENKYPLLHFLAFDHCHRFNQGDVKHLLDELTKHDLAESVAYNISLNIDEETYGHTINQLKQQLYQGNTYQVNYTGKYTFDLQGSPIKLYQALRERQLVAYSALLHFEDYQILSLSPELFFSKHEDKVTVKPMKGTMPRSPNPDLDKDNLLALTSNPKLITENIIIVDLLRNDLSRISYPGSVSVSKLLEAETYETVHQMTSTIHSRVDTHTAFKTFLYHLFPCGSITGAPKRKTMQIIHTHEKEPRHVYTGAIGYITPTNDMCFSVAIRTLLIKNQQGELGVGGGIVHDSSADDEFQELKLKARFFTDMDVDFKLIESIKYHSKIGYYLLDEHLARLKNSAFILNFKYDEPSINRALQTLIHHLSKPVDYKVRLVLKKNGLFELSYLPINTNCDKEKPKVFIYEKERMNKNNILLQHKTTDSTIRHFYDQVMAAYQEYADVLFINEDGFITEGSKTNVFIQLNGQILTPSLSCGLLAGTMRNRLLANNPLIKQAAISVDDLHQAERLWLTNSVRGIKEVLI